MSVTINLNECFMNDEPDEDEGVVPEPSLSIELTKGKQTAVFQANIEENALVVTRVGLRAAGRAASNDHDEVYFTDATVLDEVLIIK